MTLLMCFRSVAQVKRLITCFVIESADGDPNDMPDSVVIDPCRRGDSYPRMYPMLA
jgi:hypothetical protein